MTYPEEFSDTDPRAMEVWLDLLRRMPAGEKLAVVLRASEFLLKAWESEVRAEQPQAGDAEVRLRVAARHLLRDLMIRVYGWNPEIHGISNLMPSAFDDLPFGGRRVDMDYVRKWADQSGVSELLQRMREE